MVSGLHMVFSSQGPNSMRDALGALASVAVRLPALSQEQPSRDGYAVLGAIHRECDRTMRAFDAGVTTLSAKLRSVEAGNIQASLAEFRAEFDPFLAPLLSHICCRSTDEGLKRKSILMLEKMAPECPGIVAGALVQALVHVPSQRQRVLQALSAVGVAALTDLCRCVAMEDLKLRAFAIEAIGSIGPEARRAVPLLVAQLPIGDRQVRQSAARALGSIGESTSEVLAALIKAASGSDEDMYAVEALGNLGKSTREVVAKLLEIVHSGHWASNRALAIQSLLRVGALTKGVMWHLRNSAANDPYMEVRQVATLGLGYFKSENPEIVSWLRGLAYEEPGLRDAIEFATGDDVELLEKRIAESIATLQL